MKAEACFKLLGRYISYYVDKEEKLGRLVQIRIDSMDRLLVGIDENGFIEEYEIKDIQISNNSNPQRSLTRQIVKTVNKNINTFKYDLIEYYKDDIIGILNEIDSEEAKELIIHWFEKSEMTDSCSDIYEHIKCCVKDKEKANLLCGMIAYKQHDSDTAYRIFSTRWLSDKNNHDYCRDFILIADEFDNDVLCFYLLKQFFLIDSRYSGVRYYINLWWKFLFYAVKYNNFDLLEEIVITDQNVRVLIDSFTPNDIDCIYLTGGMANYDQITNTIKSVIQKPVIVAEEPLYCTATGVALSLVIQTPEGTAEITKALKQQLNKQKEEKEETVSNIVDSYDEDDESENSNETGSASEEISIDISETKRMEL